MRFQVERQRELAHEILAGRNQWDPLAEQIGLIGNEFRLADKLMDGGKRLVQACFVLDDPNRRLGRSFRSVGIRHTLPSNRAFRQTGGDKCGDPTVVRIHPLGSRDDFR